MWEKRKENLRTDWPSIETTQNVMWLQSHLVAILQKRGHNVSDLKGLVLEQVRSRDPFILKSREHMLIQKFDTFRNGLNQEP